MTDAEFAVWTLGRRFTTDFQVVRLGPGRQAVLLLRGELYALSLDELRAVIERGLVREAATGEEET